MWVKLVFIEKLHPAFRGKDFYVYRREFVEGSGYEWKQRIVSFDELDSKDQFAVMKEYKSKKHGDLLKREFKNKKVWLESWNENFFFVVIDGVQHVKLDRRCWAYSQFAREKRAA